MGRLVYDRTLGLSTVAGVEKGWFCRRRAGEGQSGGAAGQVDVFKANFKGIRGPANRAGAHVLKAPRLARERAEWGASDDRGLRELQGGTLGNLAPEGMTRESRPQKRGKTRVALGLRGRCRTDLIFR